MVTERFQGDYIHRENGYLEERVCRDGRNRVDRQHSSILGDVYIRDTLGRESRLEAVMRTNGLFGSGVGGGEEEEGWGYRN